MIACMLALILTALATASASGDELVGASREEIVALLGRPTKEKTSTSGETLVYRLLRVEGGVSTDPDLILVDLPGVGLVGRRLSEMVSADARDLTIEPTIVDAHGRSADGGVIASEQRSVTWESEEGRIVTPDRTEPDPRLRRIKLTLHLDASGRVKSWVADPPRKKQPRADG